MLKSFNNETWINMKDGTFNFANLIKFDGENYSMDTNVVKATFNSINANVEIGDTGLLIKNGMFTIMDAFNKKIFGTDLDGSVMFSGRLQPSDNSIRLFGENCRIDGSGGAIRMQLDLNNYIAVDGTATRFYNGNSGSGTRYTSIFMDEQGHSQMFGKTSMIKLLGQSEVGVQARYAGDSGYCPMMASAFTQSSRREYKENIEDPMDIDFKSILMGNYIKSYNFKEEVKVIDTVVPSVIFENGENVVKADTKIGLILDDLTEDARRVLHPTNSDGIDLYSMISVLWKNLQLQTRKIEELERKVL